MFYTSGETIQRRTSFLDSVRFRHLQTRAIVRQLPDPFQTQIDDLLPDGVVTTGEVVRGILLAADQLLREE